MWVRFLPNFKELYRGTNLIDFYEDAKSHLISSFAEDRHKGSGWILTGIRYLEIISVNHTPFENPNSEPLQ